MLSVDYQLYFLLGRGPNLDGLEGQELEKQKGILQGIIKEAKETGPEFYFRLLRHF